MPTRAWITVGPWLTCRPITRPVSIQCIASSVLPSRTASRARSATSLASDRISWISGRSRLIPSFRRSNSQSQVDRVAPSSTSFRAFRNDSSSLRASSRGISEVGPLIHRAIRSSTEWARAAGPSFDLAGEPAIRVWITIWMAR